MNDKDLEQMLRSEFEQIKADRSSEERILRKIKGVNVMKGNKNIDITNKTDNGSAAKSSRGGIIAAAAAVAVCIGIGAAGYNLSQRGIAAGTENISEQTTTEAVSVTSSPSGTASTSDAKKSVMPEKITWKMTKDEIGKMHGTSEIYKIGENKYLEKFDSMDYAASSKLYGKKTLLPTKSECLTKYRIYNSKTDKVEREFQTKYGCLYYVGKQYFIAAAVVSSDSTEHIVFKKFDYDFKDIGEFEADASHADIPTGKRYETYMDSAVYSPDEDRVFVCWITNDSGVEGFSSVSSYRLAEVPLKSESGGKNKVIWKNIGSAENPLIEDPEFNFSEDAKTFYYFDRNDNCLHGVALDGTNKGKELTPVTSWVFEQVGGARFSGGNFADGICMNDLGIGTVFTRQGMAIKKADFRIDMDFGKSANSFDVMMINADRYFLAQLCDENDKTIYGLFKMENGKAERICNGRSDFFAEQASYDESTGKLTLKSGNKAKSVQVK